MSFPGGSVVKNPPANAGDLSSIPGLGRSSGERHGNPHHSILAWRIPRTEVRGVTESRTRQHARASKDTVFLCSVSPFSKLLRLRRGSRDPPDAEHRGQPGLTSGSDVGGEAVLWGWVQLVEPEPLPQGDGVRRELNCRTVTCPQRMEGLLRGGKEVHTFGVQKHSVSRTHRGFSWTVKLRWIFTDNGMGFLQRVTSSGWGRTITDIVPVWIRCIRDDSPTSGIRWTRWIPPSYFKCL